MTDADWEDFLDTLPDDYTEEYWEEDDEDDCDCEYCEPSYYGQDDEYRGE